MAASSPVYHHPNAIPSEWDEPVISISRNNGVNVMDICFKIDENEIQNLFLS